MLGGFAVGKTSLVRRYVTDLFSEHYQTTIGVTVEKKTVTVEQESLALLLWDLYGDDAFQQVRESYLRGSSAYILVADGTRHATLATALDLQRKIETIVGRVPFVLAVNKADRRAEWEIEEMDLQPLRTRGWTVCNGSAKTGDGVEALFSSLALQLLRPAA